MFESPEDVARALAGENYIAGSGLAMAIYLAVRLRKPLLLEGEAGVGKTEVARALAAATSGRLIRLQAYEGIDASSALYEWSYTRQILAIRMAETGGDAQPDLFTRDFLIRRPILEALEADDEVPPVLLIDELDRSDDEFEAFLLEVLADYQVTIPELGTIKARREPLVFITSNRTRELHDALKRRCLYHWIDYPDFATECAIIALKAPNVSQELREQVVRFVQTLRKLDLYKVPGVAESIDWAGGLALLTGAELNDELVKSTAGLLLKNQEDLAQVSGSKVTELLETARSGS